MKDLPTDVVAYKKTPEFDENTVPKGLLKAHQTKEGVWGKIIILAGQLEYRILAPQNETLVLSPAQHGVVEPTMLHQVKPLGPVKFYVEFYQRP
ncbi:DUF1971 domain-containing protein [Dasania sp. GY-MA-18]|uniref:DUF1971 domain-containing protein n=1 Tax=Dasania phycosphaerae TaxID=2950436 RepID=A0A9J6RNV3_9GAMM|nr:MULTISPECIES: DUF1971 domain-containing protein [Dasania]MCR8923431.1 DUF1971 domain-containing protein [Dasania sp. GY-MA-18]MCZ0865864.1 DUF1971 domain-containing protein [Dasania phycosphaerae]MCZ0869588.1 DUF1971 domain-containing protein [Dasania phycosphaerae]